MKKRNVLYVVGSAVLILIALGCFVWYREHRAELFFTHALQAQGIAIPQGASTDSLERLYGQTLAERSPLFGVVGVDPAALESAVSALSSSTQEIAAAQSDPQDAQRADALYPIDFLRSLAATEAAREAFVANGSAENEQAYESALHASASAGLNDAQAFDTALQAVVGTSTITMSSSGYPITSDRMFKAASDIVANMKALDAELDKRDSCLAGAIASCDALDIALPQVAPAALPPSSAPLSPLASDFLSDLQAASPAGTFSGSQIVGLDSSLCLQAYPPPYDAVISADDIAAGKTQYMYSLGNGIFFPMQPGASENTNSFARVYGISYLYEDPFLFYECPEGASDLGSMYAIAQTAQFAQAHPALAPEDASALDGQVADEGYARAYLSQALQNASTSSDKSALISLALELNEGNAALATFINEIATVDQFNVKAEREGLLAGGTDIPTIFLTHSAFPSLFLANAISSSSPAVASIRNKDPAFFATNVLPYLSIYGSLRDTISESDIIQNMKALIAFETGMPPQ